MSATTRPQQRLHPLGALGLLLFLAGCTARIWAGEWRWAATGLVALVLLQGIGASLDQRKGGTWAEPTAPRTPSGEG